MLYRHGPGTEAAKTKAESQGHLEQVLWVHPSSRGLFMLVYSSC